MIGGRESGSYIKVTGWRWRSPEQKGWKIKRVCSVCGWFNFDWKAILLITLYISLQSRKVLRKRSWLQVAVLLSWCNSSDAKYTQRASVMNTSTSLLAALMVYLSAGLLNKITDEFSRKFWLKGVGRGTRNNLLDFGKIRIQIQIQDCFTLCNINTATYMYYQLIPFDLVCYH